MSTVPPIDLSKAKDAGLLVLACSAATRYGHNFDEAHDLARAFMRPIKDLPVTRGHAAALRFLKSLGAAVSSNMHKRSTVDTGILSCEMHYIRAHAIVARYPAIAKVLSPHLKAIAEVDVCTGRPMGR